MLFYRTTTNVPKQSNGNNNNNNQGNADVATEANGDAPENVESTVNNAQNYDAKKSRKSSTGKRQQEMENFQQKLLKTLIGRVSSFYTPTSEGSRNIEAFSLCMF